MVQYRLICSNTAPRMKYCMWLKPVTCGFKLYCTSPGGWKPVITEEENIDSEEEGTGDKTTPNDGTVIEKPSGKGDNTAPDETPEEKPSQDEDDDE